MTGKDKEKKEPEVYVADFETVVLSKKDLKKLGMTEQTKTEVWSAAIMKAVGPDEIEKEQVFVYNNIYEFMNKLEALEPDSIVYFHNLRFDGSAILSHIINVEHWTPCASLKDYEEMEDEDDGLTYGSDFDMRFQPYTYKICVSQMNQWYSLTLRFADRTIHILDSAKIFPMTLRELGEGMGCKFQKLEMKYSGINHREFGEITAEELEYIRNDVRVLSEAIWKGRNVYNLKKTTIASCALEELKSIMTEPVYNSYFPDLRQIELPCGMNVFEYTQKSYNGGWCYRDDRAVGKVYATEVGANNFKHLIKDYFEEVKNIIVLDVNSEYPFSLHSNDDRSDPHWYPIGVPEYHTGAPTQEEIENKCVFRRFKAHFDIKENHLPYIHIRRNAWYKANECLKTDKIRGKRVDKYGQSTAQEFVMTQVDFNLFNEQYDVEIIEEYDCLVFERAEGIFDDYIDKWMANKIKGKETKNKALTTVSKLMLNSIYGRLGTGLDSSSRWVYTDDDGVLQFKTHFAADKVPVAMPAASYCTSIARTYIIHAAQANYEYFRYSDTDSIHLVDINPDEVKGVRIHKTKLGYFDCEVSNGVVATWVKQKTYIEVAIVDKRKDDEEQHELTLDNGEKVCYDIICKAAGLSGRGKEVLEQALLLAPSIDKKKIEIDDDDYEIVKMYVEDFRPGFRLNGVNLKLHQVIGGPLLKPDDFSLN